MSDSETEPQLQSSDFGASPDSDSDTDTLSLDTGTSDTETAATADTDSQTSMESNRDTSSDTEQKTVSDTGIAPLHLDLQPTPVSAGYSHTCAITEAAGVRCWGDNRYRQLGVDAPSKTWTPVEVSGIEDAVAVAAGDWHSCALTSQGAVYCWGNNSYGELGVETECYLQGETTGCHSAAPLPVTGLAEEVVAISAGSHHTCALMSKGGVKCWGRNNDGRLGTGEMCEQCSVAVPVDVMGLGSSVTMIEAGASHTCALLENQEVWCYGSGQLSALGAIAVEYQETPLLVEGLPEEVAAIKSGAYRERGGLVLGQL